MRERQRYTHTHTHTHTHRSVARATNDIEFDSTCFYRPSASVQPSEQSSIVKHSAASSLDICRLGDNATDTPGRRNKEGMWDGEGGRGKGDPLQDGEGWGGGGRRGSEGVRLSREGKYWGKALFFSVAVWQQPSCVLRLSSGEGGRRRFVVRRAGGRAAFAACSHYRAAVSVLL